MTGNETYDAVNTFIEQVLRSKRPLFLWGFDNIRVIETKVFNS